MAAIITSEFRKNARALFTSDIKTSNADDYFIGLGKTDSWPDTVDSLGNQVTEYSRQFAAPLPVDTTVNKIDVLKNLMILVKTDSAEVFNVIPRNNWAANRIYKVFDPTDPKSFDYETIDGVAYYPCYVTSNDRIYFCLSNTDSNGEAIESTTAIPVASGATTDRLTYHTPQPIDNGEGYVWAYVSSLDEDSKFYTDQFVNYTYPTSEQVADTKIKQTGGLIYGFKIVNGGTNASLANTKIKILGTTRAKTTPFNIEPIATDVVIYDFADQDQSESNFNTVFLQSGGIESIRYKVDSNNQITWAADYLSASVVVEVDGVVDESIDIVPYVLSYEGLGRYPDNDLPSFYAGIAVDFVGDVDGEAPVGYNVDVRQISLVKNPERSFTDNALDNDPASPPGLYTPEEAYDSLKYLQLEPGTLQRDYIGRDFIIEQADTGARAWLDYADNINERLYYHQNSSPKVNFKKFTSSFTQPSVTVTSIAGFSDGATYKVDSCENPEYLPETGEVIFYENRKPINRNFNQTDEVKLVIQF